MKLRKYLSALEDFLLENFYDLQYQIELESSPAWTQEAYRPKCSK